ncbi:MAG: SAM-dependent methyltransferase [Euryarchaeota archaeon]|jgi:ubiquinone/menaquinone biosynthesis C-methylase UbiE|nr:SAM-dependent methyltransferase [Euryarchaeota archaeon]HJM77141.1 class I SAM-dependent methyltransferase [Candidatus Thalassarchaeaceae archaeon]
MSWRAAPPPADDEEAIRENLESWDALAHLHAQGSGAEFYRIEQWLAGESKLAPWEIEEMGSVEGKTLLHMQCHIGTDTLSWAREGAQVTGLDFSSNAISEAQRFANILGIDDSRFIVSRVSDAIEVLEGERFDILYTGRGALCWLPDLDEWARVCATLTKQGGVLYLEESTPMLNALDVEEESDGSRLVLKYDLFNEGPVSETGEGSYASEETDIERTTHCWEFRYGTIMNALIENGFRIDLLNERDELFFDPWPELFEPSQPNYWRLKKGHVAFPLSFTLKASRL